MNFKAMLEKAMRNERGASEYVGSTNKDGSQNVTVNIIKPRNSDNASQIAEHLFKITKIKELAEMESRQKADRMAAEIKAQYEAGALEAFERQMAESDIQLQKLAAINAHKEALEKGYIQPEPEPIRPDSYGTWA
ncbi:MAG: hypothetical protein RR740_00525 [Pseudomonas sp.]